MYLFSMNLLEVDYFQLLIIWIDLHEEKWPKSVIMKTFSGTFYIAIFCFI